METVGAALEQLARCLDPVLGASELVRSAESEDRMRGLLVLGGLERVVLPEPAEAEVSAAGLVFEVGVDANRGYGERAASWMSAFALCFRNSSSSVVLGYCADPVNVVGCIAPLLEHFFTAPFVEVSEFFQAWYSLGLVLCLLWELSSKCDGADRGCDLCDPSADPHAK